MRIALISDLHLDIVPPDRRTLVLDALAEELRATEADVLVIAGDVAGHYESVRKVLARLAVARLNIFVPGNHDLWLTPSEILAGRTSFQALDALTDAAIGAGFHPLAHEPILFEGWGFVGSVGWYDYTFSRPDLGIRHDQYAERSLRGIDYQDRYWARWFEGEHRLEDEEVTRRTVRDLEAQLRQLGVTESGEGAPIIVVTHHLPDQSLVEYRGYAEWDYFSAFMGSQQIGMLGERFPAVKAFFAGHTHRPRTATLSGGALAVVSPLGYYGSLEYPRDLSDRVAIFDTEGTSIRLSREPR